MYRTEFLMKLWVRSMIIAGRHSVNKEPTDRLSGSFGGIKIKLEMTISQLLLNRHRGLGHALGSKYRHKLIITAIASLKGKAPLIFAKNCKQ